jgi:hypothetical protein
LLLSLLPQFAAVDKLTITRTCSPVNKAEMNALSLRNCAPTQTPALQNKLKQTGLQKCDAFSLLTHVHTHTRNAVFPFLFNNATGVDLDV